MAAACREQFKREPSLLNNSLQAGAAGSCGRCWGQGSPPTGQVVGGGEEPLKAGEPPLRPGCWQP